MLDSFQFCARILQKVIWQTLTVVHPIVTPLLSSFTTNNGHKTAFRSMKDKEVSPRECEKRDFYALIKEKLRGIQLLGAIPFL